MNTPIFVDRDRVLWMTDAGLAKLRGILNAEALAQVRPQPSAQALAKGRQIRDISHQVEILGYTIRGRYTVSRLDEVVPLEPGDFKLYVIEE